MHCKSEVYMDDDDVREMAKLDVKSVFNNDPQKRPQLIDEWHLVPTIWDAVRRECDKTTEKGRKQRNLEINNISCHPPL